MSENVVILRRSQLTQKTGLGKSAIYDRINRESPRFDPTFPRPIKLGNTHTIGWVEAEVNAWLAAQIERSRGVVQ